MKKIILFCFLALLIVSSKHALGQITLEHTYTGGSKNFFMVDFELSGMKYVLKSEVSGNRFLKFYNLDHSFWKSIDCNPFPTTQLPAGSGTQYNFAAIYISETLFDCDSAVEFLYFSNGGNDWFTGIFKEDGTALLVADSSAPLVQVAIPQQWRPIYNTPDGTKLILSHLDGSARVYGVPCELSSGIDKSMRQPSDPFLSVFPNPSYYQNTVQYSLPDGINEADIILFDLSGKELRRYHVDRTFSDLQISQRDFPSGTYMYSLVSGNKILVSQKIVLVK